MEESPVEALRRKKDASIMRAARLVADGEADAVYSAGNTGATVVASTLSMGMLKGVKRPGIVVAVPTASGSCAVLDVGANIKCKPVHLLQYGYMGEVFAQTVLGVEKPRVGLLNIGEEDEKGNALVKETRHLMEKSDLNFVGNVEGREIFLGACDVAVMEGFVGNVLLKVVEGVIESVFTVLEAGMKRSNITELASNSFYRELKARMTYDEYGGALLLGTGGVCVIGHGRSNEKAIQNGVLTAARFVERGVIQSLADSIARSGTGG
jgi:glycerol-3-phosphate acyltransferase PlsX